MIIGGSTDADVESLFETRVVKGSGKAFAGKTERIREGG
jgi:hypothetical protein